MSCSSVDVDRKRLPQSTGGSSRDCGATWDGPPGGLHDDRAACRRRSQLVSGDRQLKLPHTQHR